MPSIAELLAALPEDEGVDRPISTPAPIDELLARLSHRRIPTGVAQRLWNLGGLQAQITAAYMVYGIRSCFQSESTKKQGLLETHLRAALKMLGTMGYLRGAVMKVGQMLANFPDVVPDQFCTVLSKLHFEAPPMHFGLLREQVRNELGGDPEDVFATFEVDAFAAASLGQVHRATLKTGESVAVKIQYPGIARSIRSDFRSLSALLWPIRLTKDWESVKQQFDMFRTSIELETDYEREAESLRVARSAFGEDDGIVVPQVYEEFSTRRVLTMEFIDGLTTDQFLKTNPSQELRDAYGAKLYRAICRLYFAKRMLYPDAHPGNSIFLADGRLGIIDFGNVHVFSDEDWGYVAQTHAALSGDRNDLLALAQRSLQLSDEEFTAKSEFVNFIADGTHLYWQPLMTDGPFDFGDGEYLKGLFDFFARGSRYRQMKQSPINWFFHRATFEAAGLQYRLRSRFDCRSIYDDEVRVTGW